MQTPQIFNFEQNDIRTVLINQEPHFVGVDVAKMLGFENSRTAMTNHVEAEDKLMSQVRASGQNRNMTVINESGLYSLIIGAAKQGKNESIRENAKKFKSWVTSEVLPSIRKHGMYATDELLDNPDFLLEVATKLKEEKELRLIAEQRVAEYEPKINYLDTILSSQDTVTITQIAADYGMSAKAFNKLLGELKVQRYVGKQWILYKKHMPNGYTKSETSNIPKSDGSYKTVMNTKWTQKGRLFIYELLKQGGLYPQMEIDQVS